MQISQLQTLPNIAFTDAAKYLVSAASDEPPILIFLDGQYVFRYCENGRTYWKLLSSSSVSSAFRHEPIDSGWLSKNIVRHGICAAGKWWVRFSSASIYNLYFHMDDNTLQKIAVPLPSLIFFGINQRYFIWAVKTKEFDKDAILYHVPLPNINLQGEICFGNNALTQDIEKDWQLFLESAFNDHNVDQKSHRYGSDVRAMLFSLADKKARKYPLNDLQSFHHAITVDYKIHSLIKELS
jgi:PRTRC genetic system protein B